jgi:hypothetical protein
MKKFTEREILARWDIEFIAGFQDGCLPSNFNEIVLEGLGINVPSTFDERIDIKRQIEKRWDKTTKQHRAILYHSFGPKPLNKYLQQLFLTHAGAAMVVNPQSATIAGKYYNTGLSPAETTQLSFIRSDARNAYIATINTWTSNV